MKLTRSDNEFTKKIVAIRQAIHRAKKIIVTSHIRPDGDAIGSLIGMGLVLQNAGKHVDLFLEDKVPENFIHLSGSELVQNQIGTDYDLVIVLDCSDLNRIGSKFNNRLKADINIDHHITNREFAKINFVCFEACATAEILAELLPKLGLIIDGSIANALLNGIVTDTIGFRTSNVRPKTLEIAAKLMIEGADLSNIYYKGLGERTFNGANYWGYGLTRLSRCDGLVWTSLTLEDRKKADYPGNDDADLINVLSSIEGAKIAMIFVEQPQGRVKISWRVCGQEVAKLDVSQIAIIFGGGGHRSAAGAIVEGSIDEIQKMVVERTQSIL